jgi:hypothetical protein
MLAKYRAAGVRLYLSDFTLEMGIPTVGVLAYDPATHPAQSEIVWTAGTTPDPQKALSRALTEVAQLAGDFNTSANYVASGLPKFAEIAAARFVTHPGREVDIQELPDLSDDNIRVEVENCVAALAQRGMEVLVIDTTHPLLGIPSFYTLIPGAHFRERAEGTSVGMFAAKLLTEKLPPARRSPPWRTSTASCPANTTSSSTWAAATWSWGTPEAPCPASSRPWISAPRPRRWPASTPTWGSASRTSATTARRCGCWKRASGSTPSAPTSSTSRASATSCSRSTARRSAASSASWRSTPARPSTTPTSAPTTASWGKSRRPSATTRSPFPWTPRSSLRATTCCAPQGGARG